MSRQHDQADGDPRAMFAARHRPLTIALDVAQVLAAAYREPHRAYHNAAHIADVLRWFLDCDTAILGAPRAELDARRGTTRAGALHRNGAAARCGLRGAASSRGGYRTTSWSARQPTTRPPARCSGIQGHVRRPVVRVGPKDHRRAIVSDLDVWLAEAFAYTASLMPGSTRRFSFILTVRGSTKRSNKLAPLGENHLRRGVSEYAEHYHLERNHQGIGNRFLMPVDTGSEGKRTGTASYRYEAEL